MYRNKKKIGNYMNYKTKILQYLTSTKPKYYALMEELISNTIFDKTCHISFFSALTIGTGGINVMCLF